MYCLHTHPHALHSGPIDEFLMHRMFHPERLASLSSLLVAASDVILVVAVPIIDRPFICTASASDLLRKVRNVTANVLMAGRYMA